MRSFLLCLSFCLLLVNVSPVPADADSVFSKEILFKPVSITFNGSPVKWSHATMFTTLTGYISYYYAGYGRFVFSGSPFPGAEQVAEVDGNVLEVHTGAVNLVMQMKEQILRDAENGVLYFRYEPDYIDPDGKSASMEAATNLSKLDQ